MNSHAIRFGAAILASMLWGEIAAVLWPPPGGLGYVFIGCLVIIGLYLWAEWPYFWRGGQ